MLRRTPRVLLLVGAAMLAAVAAVPATRNIEAHHGLPLDHLKCYVSQEATSSGETVALQDQWGSITATVLKALRYCTPVEKTHDGVVTRIKTPNGNLTLFRLSQQPSTPRSVIESSQFGEQQPLSTGPAVALAVPTRQDNQTFPTTLDHFLCYSVRGPVVSAPVTLRDQFLTESATVRTPILLCDPVQKTHNGTVTPIQHSRARITCYTMRTQVVPTLSVSVENQFGTGTLALGQADILCAPSKRFGGA